LDLFGIKILCLHINMQLEVIKVVIPFLRSFDARQASNMMAIMLDPHFKVLCVVKNLVRCENAM